MLTCDYLSDGRSPRPIAGREIRIMFKDGLKIKVSQRSPSPLPNGFPSPPPVSCPILRNRFAVRGPPGEGEASLTSAPACVTRAPACSALRHRCSGVRHPKRPVNPPYAALRHVRLIYGNLNLERAGLRARRTKEPARRGCHPRVGLRESPGNVSGFFTVFQGFARFLTTEGPYFRDFHDFPPAVARSFRRR